ncbi:reverse transcriptase domain-containing protein [Tanacetum coccineum]
MPPRRNRPLTEAYEQELEQRIMTRIDERFNQIIDQLANRMNDMMNPRRRRDHNSRGSEDEEPENLFFEGNNSSSDEQLDRPRRNHMEDNRCWESGMRVNIPEFDGDTLNPRGFIDWLVAVEEVFEFKEVPENKRVSLIATKLRGRASTWWQQLKLTRKKVEKLRVTSWMKMKKLMRTNFILHNYQRLMYQRLQNLKQGTKSIEDYTTEFYQLIARNDIQETDDQLVFGYISGLRDQIIDYVNMFDPVTLSDAYQSALAFEKHNRLVESSSSPAITGGGSGSSNVASHFVPHQARLECKKAGKRTLFAKPEEWEDDGVANDDYEEAPAENNVSFSGVVLGVEEESMPVYAIDIEDVIEEEEGFIRKRGLDGEEDNIEDVVVVANDLCSSMIQTTLNVDFGGKDNQYKIQLVMSFGKVFLSRLQNSFRTFQIM